jgi:hypothetical protein
VPSIFNFEEGSVGNNIDDGGDDLFDGGDFLQFGSIQEYVGVPYSDNLVISNSLLGTVGKYATRKLEGLFFFEAELIFSLETLPFINLWSDSGFDGWALCVT